MNPQLYLGRPSHSPEGRLLIFNNNVEIGKTLSLIPVELKMAIFEQLSTLRNIHALASVNHKWQETFCEAQHVILRGFAVSLISADVDLLEPIRAQHAETSIRTPYTTRGSDRVPANKSFQMLLFMHIDAINKDMKEKSLQTILQQFRIEDMRRLVKSHQEIRYLVDDFTSSALA